MRVLLLRDQRVLHKAGEIVEVSPLVFNNLIATGSAVEAEPPRPAKKKEEAEGDKPKSPAKKKTTKKG